MGIYTYCPPPPPVGFSTYALCRATNKVILHWPHPHIQVCLLQTVCQNAAAVVSPSSSFSCLQANILRCMRALLSFPNYCFSHAPGGFGVDLVKENGLCNHCLRKSRIRGLSSTSLPAHTNTRTLGEGRSRSRSSTTSTSSGGSTSTSHATSGHVR